MQVNPAAIESMLCNPDFFGTPVEVTHEQADRDFASWRIARTVRLILADPSPETITDPEQLFDDIDVLRPDISDPKLLHMAALLQTICITLTMDRASA